MSDKPQVYLVLGAKGSEQFSVVSDLIEFGAMEDENSLVYYSTNDAVAFEADFKVKHRQASAVAYDPAIEGFDFPVSADVDLVFIMADGLADPANVVERFHAWLQGGSCELGRIFTVVNCELALSGEDALHWYDACIHFSDVVLLGGRSRVTNRQMQDFLDRYEQKCYPCLFEYVKKGHVANPALILDAQPRRISLIFDVAEVFEDAEDEEEIEEEEIAGDLQHDPYLKLAANGKRAKPIPDMHKILGE